MQDESSTRLVQKLWNYCTVLRDDGLSYQDYLEQLTTLLFLKMAEERAEVTGEQQPIPKGYRWADLSAPQMEGAKLEEHYRKTLHELGQKGGMLGLIFRKAQNKIQDPAKLRQLIVELIGKENWLSMSADVKGDAYEGLLERNAQDVKGGAGQYFTPRPLIQAMVEAIRPKPGEVIADPACGTGGFLLAAYDYLAKSFKLDKAQKKHLRYQALRGVELVEGVGRLCAMNLFLHGIGPDDSESVVPVDSGKDALRTPPADLVEVVLTNPPFGKKSSITVVTEEGDTDKESITYNRADFWTTTSNKQLNFLQHVKSMLKMNGRAAVVAMAAMRSKPSGLPHSRPTFEKSCPVSRRSAPLPKASAPRPRIPTPPVRFSAPPTWRAAPPTAFSAPLTWRAAPLGAIVAPPAKSPAPPYETASPFAPCSAPGAASLTPLNSQPAPFGEMSAPLWAR